MHRILSATLIAAFIMSGCTTLPSTRPELAMWCDPNGIIPIFMREGEC